MRLELKLALAFVLSGIFAGAAWLLTGLSLLAGDTKVTGVSLAVALVSSAVHVGVYLSRAAGTARR